MFKTLEAILDFYTTPDNGDWKQHDCIIRMLTSDTVSCKWPDGSSAVFVKKSNRWVNSEECRAVGYGIPGN